MPDDAGVSISTSDMIPEHGDAPDAGGHTWFQRTGDAWLERGDALVLIAPSAVVPQERNAMLNPQHPRVAEVTVVSAAPFRFDPRLAIG